MKFFTSLLPFNLGVYLKTISVVCWHQMDTRLTRFVLDTRLVLETRLIFEIRLLLEQVTKTPGLY